MTTATLLLLLALSTGAGLAIVVGALIAKYTNGGETSVVSHTVLSFGGGALISAVGLVLAPDGLEILGTALAGVLFVLGGVLFMIVDGVLSRSGAPVSNIVATLLDFVPEAIIVGAVIVAQPRMAIAVSALIAAQNVPEGFAAYRQITASGSDSVVTRRPLLVLSACVVVGPLAALFGYYVCGSNDPSLGAIMAVCAGGILFIVFRDIAPKANLENSAWPALGSVLGFAVGLIGLGVAH